MDQQQPEMEQIHQKRGSDTNFYKPSVKAVMLQDTLGLRSKRDAVIGGRSLCLSA